jgi:signal transduction histidine kinase
MSSTKRWSASGSSVPVLLIGATIGGYWISRRALQPVDQITAAVELISIRSLSERLNVPNTADELQRLSETLNRMLARLNSSVQRMSQFTADASHELRAPLSLIRTTAERAANGGRTNSEYHEDMVQILTEAERTSRLIDRLLLLARADAGEGALQMEPCNLGVSLRQAIEQAQNLAGERKVRMETHIEDQPVMASGDADALRCLVFIFLENAIKYNVEGGAVRISLALQAGRAVCSVTDSGIGIDGGDLDHIIRPVLARRQGPFPRRRRRSRTVNRTMNRREPSGDHRGQKRGCQRYHFHGQTTGHTGLTAGGMISGTNARSAV